MSTREILQRQHETAWALWNYHTQDLSTEECLWRPAVRGPHVHQDSGGRWIADWPTEEHYAMGPPSIAWTSWHVIFWWSLVIDHSFGAGTATRESIAWPGSADGVRESVNRLHGQWLDHLAALSDEEWAACDRTRWPMRDRPFAGVVAWLNIELTKNSAEIGYTRFLRAAR